MDLYDTQIISGMIEGAIDTPGNQRVCITSITAQELLLTQGQSLRRNNYYVPLLSGLIDKNPSPEYIRELFRNHRGKWHDIFCQRRTDRLVLEFGNDREPVIEYSHRAIAQAINSRNAALIRASVQREARGRRQTLMRRLEFLLARNALCVPLVKDSARVGLELVSRFLATNNAKANFRNTLNDLLTLAIADYSNAQLHTLDRVLAKFAGECSLAVRESSDGQIHIDFSQGRAPRREMSESKGYVNNGWRVLASKRPQML